MEGLSVKDRVLVSYGEGLDVSIIEATILEIAVPYIKVEFKSESRQEHLNGPMDPITGEKLKDSKLQVSINLTLSKIWVKQEKVIQILPS